jgi:predicted nuclease of predicted toxin-antitoxin system
LADSLRGDGFDVVALAGHPVLAASSDPHVATWAAREDRRVVTENVRDFVPLLATTEPPLRVLLTSSRRYPRSRQNPGPLIEALRNWLSTEAERGPGEWLQ